jgi:myo-inositol-1(or 4)-monophosphatase
MINPAGARLAAAEEAANAAGRLALEHFRGRAGLVIEAKVNAQDVVSRADRDVEALIRARVAAHFPDDGFFGEESGITPGTSGFLWIVDPIDGTSPFLFGLPHWCVSIAVCEGSRAVAAAIAAPIREEIYTARAGGGARLNGALLTVPSRLTLANGLVGIGANHRVPARPTARVIERLLDAGGMFYRNGSGALMLAHLAAGRLAAYWEAHMNAWDAVAGLLIVAEAGGRCAPFCPDGDLAKGDVVLAAAPDAWDGMQALLESSTSDVIR